VRVMVLDLVCCVGGAVSVWWCWISGIVFGLCVVEGHVYGRDEGQRGDFQGLLGVMGVDLGVSMSVWAVCTCDRVRDQTGKRYGCGGLGWWSRRSGYSK
jgi:hypothetical protein